MDPTELELWKRVRNGDEQAREELILKYLPLVKVWVSRICKIVTWANRSDLMQEGTLGLIDAVDGFVPDSGKKFKAYARKFIIGAMFDNPEVKRDMTRRQRENYRLVRDTANSLMQEKQLLPTMEEIAIRSGLTLDQVMNAYNARGITFAEEFPDMGTEISLGGDSEGKIFGITNENPDNSILVKDALAKLKTEHAMIVVNHYCFGLTDPEIAALLDMKLQTVITTRKRAMKKLRALLGIAEGSNDGQ